MATHDEADGEVEDHRQGNADEVAARSNGADEHHTVHLDGADDELMERYAQPQTDQRADEGQQVDLPEDIPVDLFVVETEDFDGRQLLFALGKVDRDEIVQDDGGQRTGTDDDKANDVVQAADEVGEHPGGVGGKGHAGNVVAGQQLGAEGVGVIRRLAGGLAEDGVPFQRRGAEVGVEVLLRQVEPGVDVVLGDAGQRQLQPSAGRSVHPEVVAD